MIKLFQDLISATEKNLYILKIYGDSIPLPDQIKCEVIEAYRELQNEFLETTSKEKDSQLYVAIRSSSCEEDAEIAARAGEFETYLFITGEELLIEYLKRTWSRTLVRVGVIATHDEVAGRNLGEVRDRLGTHTLRPKSIAQPRPLLRASLWPPRRRIFRLHS